MRKLNSYNDDTFEFYKEVVASKKNSKQDNDYKERLAGFQDTVENQFEHYDDSFGNNDLVGLASHGYIDGDKADLLRLYSYKGKNIQKLKVAVTTTARNRILSTCQNCTIGEVNSFDHFVNKEEFPEFSVHPNNLFPSCTKCNSYKGQEWREHGQVTYLNLYLDNLPEDQYLFVDINVEDNDVILTEFYVENLNGINPVFFERIQNHYSNLHLCQRFQENADTVITSLENTVRTYADKLPLEDIIELVIENSERDLIYYGYNYWKSILVIALMRNDDFIEMAIN